jgi:hypothetical protein
MTILANEPEVAIAVQRYDCYRITVFDHIQMENPAFGDSDLILSNIENMTTENDLGLDHFKRHKNPP